MKAFKVMCIAELETKNGHSVPQISEIVTVRFQEIYQGVLSYVLVEYPAVEIKGTRYNYTFEAEAFAPLNGPDESVRLEAWQVEQAAKLDREFAEIMDIADRRAAI